MSETKPEPVAWIIRDPRDEEKDMGGRSRIAFLSTDRGDALRECEAWGREMGYENLTPCPLYDADVPALAKALRRAVEPLRYTLATISENNQGETHEYEHGEWVEVHKGRAISSHRQLTAVLHRIRTALATLDTEEGS